MPTPIQRIVAEELEAIAIALWAQGRDEIAEGLASANRALAMGMAAGAIMRAQAEWEAAERRTR